MGTALTAPIIVFLSMQFGWQIAICLFALPALVLGVLWGRFGADSPPDSDIARRKGEAAQNREFTASDSARTSIWKLLAKRNVCLLSISYFCHGVIYYVIFFWLFIYLVDERGFSLTDGGIVYALPTLAGAIAALAGGLISDAAAGGNRSLGGRKFLVFATLSFGAVALIVGAFSTHVIIAVAGFILTTSSLGFVDSSFWAATIEIGRSRTGSVGGIVNGMGNASGVVAVARQS